MPNRSNQFSAKLCPTKISSNLVYAAPSQSRSADESPSSGFKFVRRIDSDRSARLQSKARAQLSKSRDQGALSRSSEDEDNDNDSDRRCRAPGQIRHSPTELRRPAVPYPAIAGADRAKTLSRPAKKTALDAAAPRGALRPAFGAVVRFRAARPSPRR